MGQRSQIIILEKNSSTDKIECRKIYHNQWSYGVGFLSNLNDLLKIYKEKLKGINQNDLGSDRLISELKWNLVDYFNMVDFPETKGYSKNEFESKEIHKIEDAFKYCDNNNGYIILYFDGEKLLYDIITGKEDANYEDSISPEGYLKLFYKNDEDLKKYFKTDKAVKEIKETIESLNQAGSFASQEVVIQ